MSFRQLLHPPAAGTDDDQKSAKSRTLCRTIAVCNDLSISRVSFACIWNSSQIEQRTKSLVVPLLGGTEPGRAFAPISSLSPDGHDEVTPHSTANTFIFRHRYGVHRLCAQGQAPTYRTSPTATTLHPHLEEALEGTILVCQQV